MDFDNWHWPQVVLGTLIGLGFTSPLVGILMREHLDEKLRSWQGAFVWAIVLLATYAGGFWG